jgi:glycosyltransferase involved in cell wall biosynthesis
VKVGVVIPALNEAGNIGQVVAELLAQSVELVVVADNGSTDTTAAEAAAAGALVVSEPRRGYGYACAAGSAAALERKVDVIVYIDGDHASDPAELGGLLEPLHAGTADLVLGSRVLGTIHGGAMAPHQRVGNAVSALLMRRLYRVGVTDLGPYRAIRSELLRELAMTEMTFGWPTEMTVKTARRGARIIEVPVSWHERRLGRSKVSGTVKGSILASYHIIRVTLRHAVGGRRRSSPGHGREWTDRV